MLKQIAMVKRWFKIVFKKNVLAIKQDVGKFYNDEKIKGYYNDLTGKISNHAILDKDGLPLNRKANGELVYFHIAICQYALGCFDKYLETNNIAYRQHFIKIANYLIEKQNADGSWECFSSIGSQQYNYSSMGQGEGVSVLVRAYQLEEKNGYMKAIKKAISFMITPIENGGTMIIEDGRYFFEEYPLRGTARNTVLNGWIFSLFGIYDYLLLFEDLDVRHIFWESIDTLLMEVEKYNAEFWSYYDLSGRIASPAYHQLHIALLTVLADITNIKDFKEYAVRWDNMQYNKRFKLKAITIKVFQKLFEPTDMLLIE